MNVVSGRPLRQGVDEAIRGNGGVALCPPSSQTTPPISPKKFTKVSNEQGTFEDHQENGASLEQSAPSATQAKPQPDPVIPQFYFPRGPPVPQEIKLSIQSKVDALFHEHTEGMPVEGFTAVVKDVCDLPTMLAYPLFEKLKSNDKTPPVVHKEAFVEWWDSENMAMADGDSRLFEILCTADDKCIGQVQHTFELTSSTLDNGVTTHSGVDSALVYICIPE